MNKVAILYTIVFSIVSFVFAKNALHMFQQNRYEFGRYTKWLFNKTNFAFSINTIYMIASFLTILFKGYYIYVLVIIISVAFAIYSLIKEENKEYIKPLVLTARIKRTIILYAIITIFVYYLICLAIVSNIKSLIGIMGPLSVVLPYLLIYVVALLLKPIEYAIKKHYENDARQTLESYNDLIKVGITGSYGKTTTKNIVNQIVSSKYYSLMTPASYNTPMGITKTIREHLKRVHEVFVCEMGADHVNDIGYLMEMVKPKYGIVVSVGPQHLNTFRNMNNIVLEKMKEIEMLPKDGVGIINIDNEYIKQYKINNSCKIIKVGIENKFADISAEEIKYAKDGTSFTALINGKKRKIKTKLLGEHNITNILCAIALGLELNIDLKTIVKAIGELEPVEHRLQRKIINGFSFIDDAFNSNPVGSNNALKVLKMMPGKRIIVTPGMIDLGINQNSINYDFGKNMYDNADYVILVGRQQTQYIYKGLMSAGFNKENIIIVDKVKDAFSYVYSHFSSKDTILLENDLPDAFNK